MSQDKAFSLTVDKGNNLDQGGVKAAGRMMALEIKEQVIPMKDRYTFGRLAMQAGNIVGNGEALTKENVCERISAGTAKLDDAEVPEGDRTLFVPVETYNLLKFSKLFTENEKLGYKATAKGQVGEYDNMPVVKVPKSRWPDNVNFMIIYKRSATAPVKINDTKLHQDPPGLSGNLLEGRFYYDTFVIGAKAAGIYVEVNTGSGKGKVTAVPAINAGTGAITAASGCTVRYTTDGTDPRYSNSAKVGTAAGTGAGTVVKACQYKDGAFPSPVAEAVLTA